MPNAVCMTMDASAGRHDEMFAYKAARKPGQSGRSYGLQVAERAGMPDVVLRRGSGVARSAHHRPDLSNPCPSGLTRQLALVPESMRDPRGRLGQGRPLAAGGRASGSLECPATEGSSRRFIRPDYRLSAHPSPDTPGILMLSVWVRFCRNGGAASALTGRRSEALYAGVH